MCTHSTVGSRARGTRAVHARYTLQTESVITTCSHNQSCRDSTFHTHRHRRRASVRVLHIPTLVSTPVGSSVYRVERRVELCIGKQLPGRAHEFPSCSNYHRSLELRSPYGYLVTVRSGNLWLFDRNRYVRSFARMQRECV